MNWRFPGLLVLTALWLAVALLSFTGHAATLDAGGPSLYHRLGGYDAIAGFVDTAFPRVAAHPQLNHLFRGHAQISQLRQRQLIVDTLCHDSGGPCLYTGRDLRLVHVGLNISAAEWKTFLGVLSKAMDLWQIHIPTPLLWPR